MSDCNLSQSLDKLPKGSACENWKNVPARSSYWKNETDSVTRCEKWDTSGKGKSDSDRDRPPSDEGGGKWSDEKAVRELREIASKYQDWSVDKTPDMEYKADRVFSTLTAHWDREDTGPFNNRYATGKITIKTNDRGSRTYEIHAHIREHSRDTDRTNTTEKNGYDVINKRLREEDTKRETIDEVRKFLEHVHNEEPKYAKHSENMNQLDCPTSTDGETVLAEPLESGDEVPDVDGMNLHEGDSIIWTFPKSDGCRCGSQAIQYEQLAEELEVPVFGIAAVEAGDLHEMAERYDLSFTLISDPEGKLAAEFGVEMNENGTLERRTMFVRDGRITDVSDGVAPPELSQPDTTGCPIERVSEPVTLAQKNESTLYESIEHPSVYVITGSRGSGKSALAHRLGEKMANREDIVPVAVGVPQHIQEKYPDEWVHVDDMDSAPGDSVVIIDEAYLKFHARQSMKKGNLKMGAYVNTSRHCNRTIVFVSQNSGHLDKMAVSEADGVLIKEPGTFHMEFERAQLRDITERAKNSYDQLPGGLDNREYVYAVSDGFEGLVENDKPEWYDDEVSKSYGAACQPAEQDEGDPAGD